MLDTATLPVEVRLLVAARTGVLSRVHRATLAELGADIHDVTADASHLEALLELAWFGDLETPWEVLQFIARREGQEPDPVRAVLLMTELQLETALLAPDGPNIIRARRWLTAGRELLLEASRR